MRWHIGDVVEKLRLEKDWTAGELAEQADVSPNTITDIERGRSRRPDTLKKVAVALGSRLDVIEALVPPTSIIHFAGHGVSEPEAASLVKDEELSDSGKTKIVFLDAYAGDSTAQNMTNTAIGDADSVSPPPFPSGRSTESLTAAAISLERAAESIRGTSLASAHIARDLAAAIGRVYRLELRRKGEDPHPKSSKRHGGRKKVG